MKGTIKYSKLKVDLGNLVVSLLLISIVGLAFGLGLIYIMSVEDGEPTTLMDDIVPGGTTFFVTISIFSLTGSLVICLVCIKKSFYHEDRVLKIELEEEKKCKKR